MRLALVSMDLEEWYDLKYLETKVRRRDVSAADGVEVFLDLLARHGVRATFFVLGTFWRDQRELVRAIARAGHEIALHGADHRLLYEVPDGEFAIETARLKTEVEEATGQPVEGFRASCFSMTTAKLTLLQELGFRYDSSLIGAAMEYRGANLDLGGWRPLGDEVYERGGFVEFGLTTTRFLGRPVSVAGGGYFRLFPWACFRRLLARALSGRSLYTFYLHPFETSRRTVSSRDVAWSLKDRFRYGVGRRRTPQRVARLFELLAAAGFTGTTYSEARRALLTNG